MESRLIHKVLIVITENCDGEKYIIYADSLKEVFEDWHGECNFVPENDAKIYFAMFNDKIVNPYEVSTFEDMMDYLTN